MLSVKDIAFSYPSKEVLKSISFEVENGDIFAILGRNAAGKTTLINVLVGLLDKQRGEVIADGETIDCNNSAYYVGVMRPLSNVYLKMTPYEYLMLMGTLHGLSGSDLRNKISDFAERLDFNEHLHKKLKACSLGTKKKAEFCASIIHNPKYVVLDEPFDSLDPIVCYEMKRFLKAYAKEGGTVVVTSHALDLVQNFCNKYVIIHNGVVAANGSTNDDKHLEKIFIDVVGKEEPARNDTFDEE